MAAVPDRCDTHRAGAVRPISRKTYFSGVSGSRCQGDFSEALVTCVIFQPALQPVCCAEEALVQPPHRGMRQREGERDMRWDARGMPASTTKPFCLRVVFPISPPLSLLHECLLSAGCARGSQAGTGRKEEQRSEGAAPGPIRGVRMDTRGEAAAAGRWDRALCSEQAAVGGASRSALQGGCCPQRGAMVKARGGRGPAASAPQRGGRC